MASRIETISPKFNDPPQRLSGIPMLEGLAISIGITASKMIARIWTKDTALEEIGDSVLSHFGTHLRTARERRTVDRQFGEIADDIADRIAPFLQVETNGIKAGELEAAIREAKASITAAHAFEPSQLLALDLNAATIASYIRACRREAVQAAGLSEQGEAVFDTVVFECASYVVSIVNQLPGFYSAQARDLLSRSSTIASACKEILDALPTSSVPSEWGQGSEGLRFENKYRRAVTEYSQHVQLYGVASQQAKAPYPLSIAYISMRVDTSAGRRTTSRSNEAFTSPRAKTADLDGASLRLEDLLDKNSALLLSGNAGSGKTTLLQWIALSSLASPTFSLIADSWSDRVPFILPLRRYVGLRLPAPEDFLAHVAYTIAGSMPRGWVHSILSAGRGTLLVDGLDELPATERPAALSWVMDLLRDFPRTKLIVTSRPTAISKLWQEAPLAHAELQPMETSEILAFVSHWHAAIRSISNPDKLPLLTAAEQSMNNIIQSRPAIRALSTSPLLCALVCALHLGGGASLPSNRMEIYKTALEMLVTNRDRERQIERTSEVELEASERQTLLRSFALWLHENGASDATREDYEVNVAHASSRLYRVQSSPPEIASFLLERSGVLREPSKSHVDFVHRTFLEYLAAAEIVNSNSMGRLVKVAHEDHWREVIIMAAGHGNEPQRVTLIEGILERGRSSKRLKHRLFLLAIACMETCADLPHATRERLQDALQEVVPPRNMTEATAVASADSLAVPLLMNKSSYTAAVAASCVRALSLIGSTDALEAISSYASDKRLTVIRQLTRAWSSFSAEEYVQKVLIDASLELETLVVTSPEHVQYLPQLNRATSVAVDLARRVRSTQSIHSLPNTVKSADLSGLIDIRDLNDLPLAPELETLVLGNSSIRSLNGLERFPRVQVLQLISSDYLHDISAIGRVGDVQDLTLSGRGLRVFSMDESVPLRSVSLGYCESLEKIFVPRAEKLSIGYAPRLSSIVGLASALHLRRLVLQLMSSEIDRSPELPPRLEELHFHSREYAPNLQGLHSLTTLRLSGLFSLETIDQINQLKSLAELHLAESGNSLRDAPIEDVLNRLQASEKLASVTLLMNMTEAPKELDSSRLGGWSVQKLSDSFYRFEKKSS